MKKEDFKKLGRLFLGFAIVLGAVISILTLVGSNESVRKYLAGFFIVVLGLFGAMNVVDVDHEQGTASNDLYFVNEVIDGDTIKIDGDMKVRLIGIDAPESSECYYEEAKNELIRLVQGKYVRLDKDIDSVDGLGRLLRYVYVPSNDLIENDIFVNEHLLLYGYAQTFSLPPNKRYNMSFVKAREQALIQRKGLWSNECDYLNEFEQEHVLTREINELPSDPNCIIKGNISSRGAGKLYFPLGCSSYNLIKIDTSKGEQYFCTEEEAIVAGFTKSGNCP
ncbi:MAG: thermonuclease family protein [Mariniphaga sp.]|nr:thermonuclease family protein [Mariniphaga sp.]